MITKASNWSATSKDFVPSAMPQPYAANGASTFNAQASTFTPAFAAPPLQGFNQNAQSFNPAATFAGQPPVPPQGAPQPSANAPINTGGMNSLYANQGRWQGQMHHPPAGAPQQNFTPPNAGQQFGYGYQPAPSYPAGGPMASQGYGGYYGQGYGGASHGNDGQYGARAANAPLYN